MTLVDPRLLPDDPADGYEHVRALAVRLAGAPADIVRRVMVHHQVYRDSNGNHAFPLVALHGALWAAGFFETTGRLGDALRARYFYSTSERTARMTMLGGFAEGFKSVNRQVFIDTFTNYFYTKHYGRRREARRMMQPELFGALNAVHAANRAGVALDPADRREVFALALEFEQEMTVAPGIAREVARFDCPVLRFLCLRPLVRFLYFPRREFLWFRNFADKAERIAKAMTSYDVAARTGWERVEGSMRSSALLPPAYWVDPAGFARQALPVDPPDQSPIH